MSATFSAVVVVRNEEALIRRCLESVAWCDERIDIDLDSTDRTRERAPALDIKIVPQAWIPHMEWVRNRGIERATGDWILVVDADKVITAKLGYPDHQLRCFRRGTGLYPDRLHSYPEIDGRTLFMPAEEDAWILHSLPRMAAALTGHGLGRLWARRSPR